MYIASVSAWSGFIRQCMTDYITISVAMQYIAVYVYKHRQQNMMQLRVDVLCFRFGHTLNSLPTNDAYMCHELP